MRRTLTLFVTLVILWMLVAQLNHVLTAVHVYVFVGSLYVCHAALHQPLRPGLAATILGGLICDANAPVEIFGTHMLLFAAAHVTVFHLRDRVPRDDTIGRVLVALLTNLALFLAFSFSQIGRTPVPAIVWPRLLADLVCSQVLLTLIAPWFFALQGRALILMGADREELV